VQNANVPELPVPVHVREENDPMKKYSYREVSLARTPADFHDSWVAGKLDTGFASHALHRANSSASISRLPF
jgi:hypothetical protein